MILGVLQSAEHSNLNTVLAFVVPFVLGCIAFLWQRRVTAKALRLKEAEVALAEEKARSAEERWVAIAKDHEETKKRIDELEGAERAATLTLAALKQEMMPFSEFAKRKLIESLTHPSGEFKEDDGLLARVKGFGAAMPRELLPRLQERIESKNPHVTEFERLAAEGLPIFTRMAQLEALHPDWEVTGMQLVTTTLKTPETKAREESK